MIEEDSPDFTVTLDTEGQPTLNFFELEKTILNAKAVNHREFFILQNPELERLYWFSPDTQFLNSLRSEEGTIMFFKLPP